MTELLIRLNVHSVLSSLLHSHASSRGALLAAAVAALISTSFTIVMVVLLPLFAELAAVGRSIAVGLCRIALTIASASIFLF